MSDNFFPQDADVIIDPYEAGVLRNSMDWQPAFNKLVKLYAAGSIVQPLRHVPVCKICGDRASMILNDKQTFISECLIKVAYSNFAVLIPSVFLHLAQVHGFRLSEDAEKFVMEGDVACYERLTIAPKKLDSNGPPNLDIDGW